MGSHLVFFVSALSFIFGIASASLGLTAAWIVVPAAMLFAALYIGQVDWRIGVLSALLVLVGFAYYTQDDLRYRAAVAAMPQSGEVVGVVTADPKAGERGTALTLKTSSGILLVQTSDTDYAYGDRLKVRGIFEPPPSMYFGRHVVAVIQDPDIRIESRGEGNPVLTALYHLKHLIKGAYDRSLGETKSGFLFGIMFGDNGYIPKDLAQELDESGLRFITAIDGLHMLIVIYLFIGVLEWIVPRRYAVVLTTLFAFSYVALTGFTVSGIRASIMAFVARFAKETRRVNLSYNTLALAALALTLLNPKVLLFDVGFQLSFVAVIAIVYLVPLLRHVLDRGGDAGAFEWKDALLITIAVQISTAPIVMTQFQSFSFTSWMASMLVVPLLPVIIGAGFALALASLVHPLASVLSVFVGPLVSYVLLIVSFFAKFSLFFNPQFGFTGVVIYYGALTGGMLWYHRRREKISALHQDKPKPIEPTGFEIYELS